MMMKLNTNQWNRVRSLETFTQIQSKVRQRSNDKSMDKIYSFQQMVLGRLNIHIQITETRHRTYNISTHMHKLNNRPKYNMKIYKSSRKK